MAGADSGFQYACRFCSVRNANSLAPEISPLRIFPSCRQIVSCSLFSKLAIAIVPHRPTPVPNINMGCVILGRPNRPEPWQRDFQCVQLQRGVAGRVPEGYAGSCRRDQPPGTAGGKTQDQNDADRKILRSHKSLGFANGWIILGPCSLRLRPRDSHGLSVCRVLTILQR